MLQSWHLGISSLGIWTISVRLHLGQTTSIVLFSSAMQNSLEWSLIALSKPGASHRDNTETPCRHNDLPVTHKIYNVKYSLDFSGELFRYGKPEARRLTVARGEKAAPWHS
jgi:hypothetical protein